MEHSWIPSGMYDEHCVHRFPCVGSGWAGVHLNTTDQSRSTSPLVPHLWIAGCRLADGDVTDDRDTWCWTCVNSTQRLSGWLWHSLIAECRWNKMSLNQEFLCVITNIDIVLFKLTWSVARVISINIFIFRGLHNSYKKLIEWFPRIE